MTGYHDHDMPLIRRHIARRKGWLKSDGTPNEARVKKWLARRRLTPHHHKGDVVLFVDTDTHRLHHTGSALETRTE